MFAEHIELIEAIGMNIGFIILFFLIGMAIHDVLNKGQVPRFGRLIVWMVLFLGCAGFIAKGVIQIFWEGQGLG
ncbi:DUF2788 domain-containing protein [Alginatibacterium sediminis]|uniref:DUF2788 domain-containing protein n=1 Tax=Alginatibacterium sediminis TaxID=2164068 RepID=A0A420EAY3_9ALTE|nr:DUF2788 domain-containing protein [Alginatibacterium sediminis]RKF17848.1 DUF2788 domain-containing protein [Alginatibacterium sediminis]